MQHVPVPLASFDTLPYLLQQINCALSLILAIVVGLGISCAVCTICHISTDDGRKARLKFKSSAITTVKAHE